MDDHLDLTPQLLVRAYRTGIFPMACSRTGPIEWHSPDPRAILPLEAGAFHVPKSLARRVRSDRFTITRNQAFDRVIRACAEPRRHHHDTWINPLLIAVYSELHRQGLAHSVEAWVEGTDEGRLLVGGLYGVALSGAFFGESMFKRATDASKVCLVELVEHLRGRGFVLLDVQFSHPHLEQFGVAEIRRDHYLRRLEAALRLKVTW